MGKNVGAQSEFTGRKFKSLFSSTLEVTFKIKTLQAKNTACDDIEFFTESKVIADSKKGGKP